MKLNSKLNQFISSLKEELGLFLSISFGVFLFILFFEPFSLEAFDFNNRLLFVAGIAAIVFTIMSIVRIAIPWFIHKYDERKLEPVLPPFINSFIILLLSTVAIVIYIHYIGSVLISFYLVFKIGIICIALPVSLRLFDLIKELKTQNVLLLADKETAHKRAEEYREEYLNKPFEFVSDQGGESLRVLISDVAFIRSADNYVEIVYEEDEQLKSRLIRNTLKNIEQQLQSYPNFIRCHRTSIVNSHYVVKLQKDGGSYSLIINGFDERIPVSRQYLLKLKEAL
ncbi:MAG: LytTR family transcriptional regulator DNA-binding domain-containing protein [Bacteroidales bacterium]|nr:LytTR family transcriptional regulator DNA-binding domain-containing protein [Bacteroidales bacterium]